VADSFGEGRRDAVGCTCDS